MQRAIVVKAHRRIVIRIDRILVDPAGAFGHAEEISHAADRADGLIALPGFFLRL